MSTELQEDEKLLEERKALFWERTDYDRAFRGTAGAYMTEVEAWALDRVFEDRSADTLLDLGCGHGRFLRHFAPRARKQMIGLDRSRRLLGVAQELMEEDPLPVPCELLFASATEVPLADDSVGAITCVRVLQHVPGQETALREVCRVLEPEGSFVLVQYNWLSPHGFVRALKIPVKATLRFLMRAFGKEPGFDERTMWKYWPSLRKQLEDSGLEVEKVTGAWLFPIQYTRNKSSNDAWGPFLKLAYVYEKLADVFPFKFLGGYIAVRCRVRQG
jgi:ubiquinone/menaquinone biosynthesis C-methylase UbiE